MTQTEQSFLIWSCLSLLAIIAFIGAIFVNAFLKMGKDVHEIKLALTEQKVKLEDFERRVDTIEDELKYQFRKN